MAARALLYRHRLEVPVLFIIGLTDADREELSRRVAEANKRSEQGRGR